MVAADFAVAGLDAVPRPRAPLELLDRDELEAIADAFRGSLRLGRQSEPRLAAAVADILEHPGSLARAQLAFAVGRAWGLAVESARRLAVAVEYFHTASLVFDDLPSMDDAVDRRGRPCPHRVFGEATATLGALGLINRAYGLLWEAVADAAADDRRRATRLVDECLGIDGVLGGQSRDLGFEPERDGAEEVLEVARGKTVSLIRMTLVLPALVAGAAASDVDRLERLSVAWGLAYQIVDDAKDRLLSDEETGKSTARDRLLGRPNFTARSGWEVTCEALESLLATSARRLRGLSRTAPALWRLQAVLEAEADAVRRRLELLRCA